jgi:hypothetical protein
MVRVLFAVMLLLVSLNAPLSRPMGSVTAAADMVVATGEVMDFTMGAAAIGPEGAGFRGQLEGQRYSAARPTAGALIPTPERGFGCAPLAGSIPEVAGDMTDPAMCRPTR